MPDYEGGSLRAVLPAALDAIGAPTSSSGHDSASDRAALGLPEARKVCLVLVDGLGAHMLAERGGHAPFLRSHLPSSLTLTCGYPSTTAASLTMFGTGSCPGQTGMLGYTVRNDADGSLLNLVTWEEATISPREWQPQPTLVERLGVDSWGQRVASVGPARFVGSGLTEAALRGPRFVAADSLADRVDAASSLLRDRGTDLVYLYWGDVDKMGHHHGWGSWQWGEAVELLDSEISRLRRQLPAGTLLLVTADHGMVDLRPDSRIDVAATPELDRDVVLIAGEPRAVHVHTEPGTAPAVADRWRDVLEDTAWVLLREEAEEIGLFGPLSERHRATVGDVVVATRGLRAVVDSRTQTPSSIALVGVHGSLTPAELEIPLLRVEV
ncbi:alkaline phosphatase family protein [Georgenia sp. 311]|uniref:Alkaline phosphatase family protein n=2 Tax=Bogoriellaceae TaxID=145358 RepID=A0ABX5VQF9_9MICO|nr:alkaline phosphatase family protein [Georgenia wutianyii]TNC19591.1 alkaline phosphatase family protein [Georgenia sp. 311]